MDTQDDTQNTGMTPNDDDEQQTPGGADAGNGGDDNAWKAPGTDAPAEDEDKPDEGGMGGSDPV